MGAPKRRRTHGRAAGAEGRASATKRGGALCAPASNPGVGLGGGPERGGAGCFSGLALERVNPPGRGGKARAGVQKGLWRAAKRLRRPV